MEKSFGILEDKKHLGGAPFNVNFHLNKLGTTSYMISKIGNDELGESIIKEIEGNKISTKYIQKSKSHKTGIVMVKIIDNEPNYEIVMPVSYDFIKENE